MITFFIPLNSDTEMTSRPAYLLPTSFQPSSFFPFLGLEVGVVMVAITTVPRGERVMVGVGLPTVEVEPSGAL